MKSSHQVLLAFAIILGVVAWALNGVSEADPYRDVSDVTAEPATFSSSVVSVKGSVVAGSIEDSEGLVRFLVKDESGDPARNDTTMRVTYGGVLPDAFGPKMVVVTGSVVETMDGFVFQADDIQVGCSSKY